MQIETFLEFAHNTVDRFQYLKQQQGGVKMGKKVLIVGGVATYLGDAEESNVNLFI